jgi:hypothetical protein
MFKKIFFEAFSLEDSKVFWPQFFKAIWAFPGVESYTAVLIRDKYFVGIVKSWFDRRVYKRCQAND